VTILGCSKTQLDASGGAWTAREIAQQPAVWRDIERVMSGAAAALGAFLEPLLARPDLRIVLTGAGTSAFVGECLAPSLKRRTQRRVDAVATTDLVGSPGDWFEPGVPTLLVSFARSGNSPESVAVLTLAGQALSECHHLIITCNRDGALCLQGQRQANAHVLILPEETNDRGFAMTSSFTGMMLAAALAFHLLPSEAATAVCAWGEGMLEAGLPFTRDLAGSGFERVVYLGAREFKGLAREAALKLLELSDGKVIALAETPLGFRHGPKTVVNGRTLVVMFLGNDAYARRYELDLLRELRADAVAARVVALYPASDGTLDAELRHGDGIGVPAATGTSDLALCFAYAIFAQTFAFLQSLSLGLRPDSPNAQGVVNRVVQGVSVYRWNPHG
jgi:tagatose-6-phosphate ketose/aldose isomerase